MAEITHLKPYIAISNDDVPSKGGREPPGDDPMDVRVTKLEALAEDTRGTLESIQRQLARMDAKLDAKPDQGWIVNLICVIFGLVLAAVAASAAIFALIK